MMKRRTALHALALGVTGFTLFPLLGVADAAPKPKPTPAPKPIVVSPHSVILPAPAPGMFPQCSRGTPSGIDGYWTPTVAQAAQLEKNLKGLKETQAKVHPSDCYRQYVGFTRKGRKLIYINGFAPAILKEEGDIWKRKPINVCDGGAMFWSVEYDVAARSFRQFQTNGLA